MPDTRPTFAEVLLHATIALITGVIVAAVALSVTSSVFLAGYGIDYKSYTFGAGTTAALVTWYYLLANYVFPRLRVDKPKPQPPAVTRIEHVSPDKKQLRYEDCPASLDQLKTIAIRVYYGGGISNAEHEDVFGGRPGYTAWRAWMVDHGYLRWRGSTPQGGVEITDAGADWLSQWYTPPSPAAYAYRNETDLGVTHTPTQGE